MSEKSTIPSYQTHIRPMAVLLLGILLLSSLPANRADPDLWGYLAFGRLFWEHGYFPYRDVFSYVQTKEMWVYHEWLTGIVFYPIYVLSGEVGLQAFKIVMALGTVAFVALAAYRRGAGFWGIILSLFVIRGFLSLGYSPVRAQIFTYFFFMLTLVILDAARQSQKWTGLAWLIPIQILWCNFHGGFLAGLGLTGIYLVGEAVSRRPWRPYLLALLASGLATLINPYGIYYWSYIFEAVAMPRPEIIEWFSVLQALQQGIYQGHAALFLLVVSMAAGLIWLTGWKDVTAWLALAVTGYLGMKHIRHQVFFLLLAASYLAAPLSGYLESFRERQFPIVHRLRPQFLIVSYLIVLCLCTYELIAKKPFHLTLPSVPERPNQTYYPLAAVEYIRTHFVSGKILTDFNWGEYLLWNLHPDYQVAVDGRYETVYPPQVMHLYQIFIHAKPGWEEFLEKYPPDIVLIRANCGAAAMLQEYHQWKLVYRDAGCVLFIRSAHLENQIRSAWMTELSEWHDNFRFTGFNFLDRGDR